MCDDQLIKSLENSACALLAAPNLISEDQRHAAEQFFLAFEKSAVSLETCRQILETSKNEFVLFRTASLFRRVILRDWCSLGLDIVDSAHVYMLNYAINHTSLAACVREQMILTLAIIYKRRQVEAVAVKNTVLFQDIDRLIQTGDTYMQLVACSILLALLNEFSSSSRTSSIGLTWEQHSKCKIKFEQNDLLEVFVFCLQTLPNLLSKASGSTDRQVLTVIERLLTVLEQIFSWDFTPKVSKQMMSLTSGQATSFRPPLGWRNIILTQTIISVLFEVHMKVRENPSLCNQSLLCLAQLASLNGPIFENDEVSHRDFVLQFVQTFIAFASGVELKSSECLGVAAILKSLLEFTPTWAILELPENILSVLLSCMTHLTCNFCRSAYLNTSNSQSDDNSVYMESFEKVLDAWMTFVNHANDLAADTLRCPAIEIFGTYLQCHQSSAGQQDSSDEYEDEDEEDCVKFCDQLFAIGSFARLIPDYSIPLLNRLLQEKLSALAELLQRIQPAVGCSSADQQLLDNVNEDLHWLLLITSNVLLSCGDGDMPLIPELLIEYTISHNPQISVASLVSSETGLTSTNSQMVELIAAIFRLAQLETKAFQANLVAYLSPQVAQSLMGLLSRWASAYLIFDEQYYAKMSPVFSASFGADSESSSWLIGFLLDKILANLSALNSEAVVVTKTLDVLKVLVNMKNRCDVTVKCSAFWNMASAFSSNSFPFNMLSPDGKKTFCQTLILASSANVSPEQRQTYVQMVLGSFSKRFKDILGHPDLRHIFHNETIKVEVQNALDCLGAAAGASCGNNAVVVFEYMKPILVDAVSILDLYHNYEEVVQLVLELFSVATKQLSCYLPKRDSVHLYEVCLQMMKTFAKHNQGRRVISADAEEDQFRDLLSLIEVITNILTKDFINFADPENGETVVNGLEVDVADVALYGINILIPLMTSELLKIPALCSAFLGLLAYMAEVHATQMVHLFNEHFGSLSSGVQFALHTHGTDVTRVCLELVSFLAAHTYQEKCFNESSSLFRFGKHFLKVLFELLLLETFDVELMEVASSAVFILLCCHKQHYCELVNELLKQHSTSPYYDRLLDAFNKLTPPNLQLTNCRQDRSKFSERFDQFLVNVRGFMCVR